MPILRVARTLGLVAGLLGGLLPALASAQGTPSSREYQVKAAYILNFARYVEWPPEAFASDSAPIVVGVLGHNPFGVLLAQTLSGRTGQGRRFVVRMLDSPADAQDVHVVFVAYDEWQLHPEFLERLRRRGLLTIGEGESFARRGGVVSFVPVDQTVRFAVNLAASQRSGLRISSRMLALASAVFEQAGSGRR